MQQSNTWRSMVALGTGGSADGGAVGDAEGIIFANGIPDYAMIG
ncbi:MAG: hypothetical protein NT070_10985 [Cyanobacteria bacterium]|nr:hypothetical protein [Cyanobacteriota bacterium]